MKCRSAPAGATARRTRCAVDVLVSAALEDAISRSFTIQFDRLYGGGLACSAGDRWVWSDDPGRIVDQFSRCYSCYSVGMLVHPERTPLVQDPSVSRSSGHEGAQSLSRPYARVGRDALVHHLGRRCEWRRWNLHFHDGVADASLGHRARCPAYGFRRSYSDGVLIYWACECRVSLLRRFRC
jgi:hypothetical protein